MALVQTTHQYAIAKLPFIEQYDLIINPYRGWAESHRPFPEKCNMVTHYERGKYDFAILHIDQQSIYDPEHGERISKGRLYQEVNSVIDDIPKIVINHMTPFHDNYESPKVVEIIKGMVGDNHMIVNSRQAKEQWGWGYPIIHGMEVDEWWDLPKEPRAVVALSRAGMEKAYRRILLHQVIRILKEWGVPFRWIGVDIKFDNFDDYRDYLGRSLVYFNPTWNSPRPRSRTEAMLSGCCTITTPYHDADSFIEDGKNGFLTSKHKIKDPRVMDNPEFIARMIKRLVVDDPDEAKKVGQAGRETARKLFNSNEFAKQWQKYLTEVIEL